MDQNQAPNPEDQIVDQIGELMQQLSPEKQKQLVDKLSEMMGDSEGAEAEHAPMQTVSPEGGTRGKPVGF